MAVTLDDLMTTTLRYRAKKVQDTVMNNNILLYLLKEKGRVKKKAGGRTIIEEINYAENVSFQWYHGPEQLNIAQGPHLTAFEYDWKQASCAVSMTGRDKLINSGDEAIIDLLDARLDNAETTMTNQMEAALFGDGTGSGGKAIGGLQLYVADDPTSGTIGGIDRASNEWARNQVYSFAAHSVTPGSTTIVAAMNKMAMALTRGNDGAKLWVADDTYFGYYEDAMQSKLQLTNPKLADAGFQNYKYKGADLVHAGGMNGSAPANHMYALNLNTLRLVVHPDRFMAPMGPERVSLNQDVTVKFLGFFGNLTCSNPKFNGVIKA